MLEILKEAKDLNAYKTLIHVFGEYTESFPATGTSKVFKSMLQVGLKVVPKDKTALSILDEILDDECSVPAKVQQIMNMRFSDLSFSIRPIYLQGNSKLVAFWNKGGKIYDRVFALLNLEDEKDAGFWSDMSGNKVTLIDKNKKEE